MALFYFILFFLIPEKWLYFSFHPFLSPSSVELSTHRFSASLSNALLQGPSISLIARAAWAFLHDTFLPFPAEIFLLICIFSTLLFLIVIFLIFFFWCQHWQRYLLKEMTGGNGIGGMGSERDWGLECGVRGLLRVLERLESKAGSEWSRGEVGRPPDLTPPCPSHPSGK